MPARAATIALATAYQESKLYNVEGGDRDSLGLFQQRPSQGWGTPEQVLDPFYAANAFYDELADVDGYEAMEVTVAAQEVQRSGFPDAYADHEADARVLASALTGNSAARSAAGTPTSRSRSGTGCPTPGSRAGPTSYAARWTGCSATRSAASNPAASATGHMEGSAHYDGRAIDIFVRPVNDDNRTRGWAIAQYLVAQADRLGVETVIFDDRIWKSGAAPATAGATTTPPDGPGDRAILEHRDHVHVDVFD